MRPRAFTDSAPRLSVPPVPVRKPLPSPAEPPLLTLPECVSAEKIAELRRAREGQVPLSSSAPGDFAALPVGLSVEPVDEFCLAVEAEPLDDDDGCLFPLEDDDDFVLPTGVQEEKERTAESPGGKMRTSSVDSVSTAPGTPPLDGFAGSPVLHACLLDIHAQKRARASSRDAR